MLALLPMTAIAAGAPRYENIRDVEVREIQLAVAKVMPGELTSIGTVIAGCRCEESGSCTDEVLVSVGTGATLQRSLSMVKVDEVWAISRLSRWQLELDKLTAGFRTEIKAAEPSEKPALRADYNRRLGEALRDRPACTSALLPLRDAPPAATPRP